MLWCNNIWCNLVWPNTVLLKGLRQGTIYRAPACRNTLILHRNENITVVFKVYIFILISGTKVKLFAFQRQQSSMWGLKYSQQAKYSSIPPVTNYLPLPSHTHTHTHTHTFTYTLCMSSHAAVLIQCGYLVNGRYYRNIIHTHIYHVENTNRESREPHSTPGLICSEQQLEAVRVSAVKDTFEQCLCASIRVTCQ